jgi:hypothetical protein
MDSNAILALVGGVIVAFIIRIFNVVVEWLAGVLGVSPPDPIPDPQDAAQRPPTGHTGANPGTSDPTAG